MVGKLAPPPAVVDQLKQILLARDVAFKYILVTGLLGKLTNAAAHPRALQAQADLAGAYDARRLCHKVIVRFEKDTKLNLFGKSNEPLVGKPARHPVHDKANKQLKNKRLATVLHDVLELARRATPAEVEAMLMAALRIGRDWANTRIPAAADLGTNLGHVLDFVREFLTEGDSGARLVAVTGAFLSLLSESYTVKVYHSSASDQFAGTAGDIEVYAGKSLYSAYECKHRPLNLDDVRHGIDKSKTKGVPEYCFITAAGLAKGQEAAIRAEIKDQGDSLDVSLLDIHRKKRFQEPCRLWPRNPAASGPQRAPDRCQAQQSAKRRYIDHTPAELREASGERLLVALLRMLPSTRSGSWIGCSSTGGDSGRLQPG